MSSDLSIKIYAMIKLGIIKSNASFWREFSKEKVENYEIDLNFYKNEIADKNIDLICALDDSFPNLNLKIKNSEKPFLFAYMGNIDLLSKVNNNIAVIGVLNPTEDIETREQRVVEQLVKNKFTIVSGLASGCDTVAHKKCLGVGGKTIAILPTTFDNIYPKDNSKLVDEIVKNNGLVITEYVTEPKNRFERIKRFIERDRLQAMFSKAVIMIASYRQGQGDSGSRHAMQKAKEYGKQRYIMFNVKTDKDKTIFGLNRDLLNDGATILTEKSIKEIIKWFKTDNMQDK